MSDRRKIAFRSGVFLAILPILPDTLQSIGVWTPQNPDAIFRIIVLSYLGILAFVACMYIEYYFSNKRSRYVIPFSTQAEFAAHRYRTFNKSVRSRELDNTVIYATSSGILLSDLDSTNENMELIKDVAEFVCNVNGSSLALFFSYDDTDVIQRENIAHECRARLDAVKDKNAELAGEYRPFKLKHRWHIDFMIFGPHVYKTILRVSPTNGYMHAQSFYYLNSVEIADAYRSWFHQLETAGLDSKTVTKKSLEDLSKID